LNEGFAANQSRRLFPLIAVGGTLGAMTGSWFTSTVSEGFTLGNRTITLEAPHILLVSAGLFCAATFILAGLLRVLGLSGNQSNAPRIRFTEPTETGVSPSHLLTRTSGPPLSRDPFAGLKLILQSRFLILIAAYLFLYALTSNFLYFAQGSIIEKSFDTREARTAAFANLDFYTNLVALICQCLITGRLVKWIGVGPTLTVTPIFTLIGLALITRDPTIPAIMFAQITRRGLHYAVDRPPREALYGVLSTDAKYKSKNFIDTVVYRTADIAGALLWTRMLAHDVPVLRVAAPLIVVWVVVALAAGVMYSDRARRLASSTGPASHSTPDP